MPNLYFPIGKTGTLHVSDSSTAIVVLPGASKPLVTITYTGQLKYSNLEYLSLDALVELGNPKIIAPKLASKLCPSVQEAEARAREIDVEWLKKEIELWAKSMPKRAEPFLEYAVKTGAISYQERRVIDASLEIADEGTNINAILEPIYTALREKSAHVAKEKAKAAINYIKEGRIDEETINYFAEKDHLFEKLKQPSQLEYELQNPNVLRHRDLQQHILQTLIAIKSGQTYDGKIAGVGIISYLEELIGITPARQFFAPIWDVKEGKNPDGLLNLVSYNGSVPEEFKDIFLPSQKLAQIIILLDRSLESIIGKYTDRSIRLTNLFQEHNVTQLALGLFIRALMPENVAANALYPSSSVNIPNNPKLSKQLEAIASEDYKNGTMARLTAPELGLTEEELSKGLERVISTLNNIMPLLPFDVYLCMAARTERDILFNRNISLREEIDELTKKLDEEPNEETRRERRKKIGMHDADTYRINGLKISQQEPLRRMAQFGINLDIITEPDLVTIEQIIALFGEDLAFIRKLNLVDS